MAERTARIVADPRTPQGRAPPRPTRRGPADRPASCACRSTFIRATATSSALAAEVREPRARRPGSRRRRCGDRSRRGAARSPGARTRAAETPTRSAARADAPLPARARAGAGRQPRARRTTCPTRRSPRRARRSSRVPGLRAPELAPREPAERPRSRGRTRAPSRGPRARGPTPPADEDATGPARGARRPRWRPPRAGRARSTRARRTTGSSTGRRPKYAMPKTTPSARPAEGGPYARPIGTGSGAKKATHPASAGGRETERSAPLSAATSRLPASPSRSGLRRSPGRASSPCPSAGSDASPGSTSGM